jgi:EAL domain-containing protein (putative c-di-GMP-specific phosphodiesterase class I)
MGLSTALDDFGVGFSSLKHLREIEFDRLKLDRSFVQGISDNTRSQVFVGAIIDLARKLGLNVVVEGVEDVETADTLARLGCDYGQGYLYGRPAPADAARLRLAAEELEAAASTGGSPRLAGPPSQSSMPAALASA